MTSFVCYPTVVSIDAKGTAEIFYETTNITLQLTRSEIDAAHESAALSFEHIIHVPEAPYLVSSSRNSISIGWVLSEPPGISRRVEVQYRRFSNGTPSIWEYACTRRFEHPRFGTFNLDSLCPGVEVAFRVRYWSIFGSSVYSPSSNIFITLPDRPLSPDSLICVHLFPTCALIRWNKAIDNGSPILYYILRGRSVGGEFTTLYTGLKYEFLVLYLFPEFSYSFEVCAVNGIGQSNFSTRLSILTPILHRRCDTADGIEQSPSVIETLSRERRDVWIECFDQSTRREYFFNRITGARQLEVPIILSSTISLQPNTVDGSIEEIEKTQFRTKRYLFVQSLRKANMDSILINKRAYLVSVRREHVLYDGFKTFLNVLSTEDFKRRFKIDFVNERGIDSGGLAKEFFLLLSRQAFLYADSARKLLSFDSGGGFYFSPPSTTQHTSSSIQSEQLNEIPMNDVVMLNAVNDVDYALFLGRLVGKCIYQEQLIEIPLSTFIAKCMLDIEIGLIDVQKIDTALYNSLKWILENNITGVIDETFSVLSSATKKEVDLCEGGSDKIVTEMNKAEFVKLRIAWAAKYSIHDVLESFLKGFWSVVPLSILQSHDITPDELSLMLQGQRRINIDQIRAYCIFNGSKDFDDQHPTVVSLWGILREFNDTLKELFLRFVTGTSRIPLDGFSPPFSITQGVDMLQDGLPKSHTCFNQLVLPTYSTLELFRERLIFAIENCVEFELA